MSDASFAKLQESVNGSKDLGTTTAAPPEGESRLETAEQVHTPGPLFVGSVERTAIVRGHPNGFVLYRGFSECDAALFAAAPDMLAALKEVMNEWREGYGLRCKKQVHAAIAKAEGR